MTGPFKVAFSLLDVDRAAAHAILLATGLGQEAFLYSEHQRELLVTGDGVAAFSDVFRSAALAVVLYRTGWGKTKWTRIEERVIEERFLEEGEKFLLLIRMDNSNPPAWFPKQLIWADSVRDAPEVIARAIAERLASGLGTTFHTARSFDRRPAPLARYQQQVFRITSVHLTMDPEICDACSSLVQYRMLTRYQLPEGKYGPAISEQFCPPCVRLRGGHVSGTPVLKNTNVEDITIGDRAPTLAEFVNYWLVTRGYQLLRCDPDLLAKGVASVGGSWGSQHVEVRVSIPGRTDLQIPLDLVRLRAEVSADWQVTGWVKAFILERLALVR